MDAQKIARINALAKKAKEGKLTPDEIRERDTLRAEYIAAWRNSMRQTLDRTYFVDENGNETPLKGGR